MVRFRTWLVREWPTLAVILVGSAIQLFLVTRSADFLLNNLVADDTLFYFNIARHALTGGLPTFDGIHPTNGFHPLWLLTLIGIYKLFSSGAVGDMAPIHIALELLVVVNIFTALTVSRILARFTDSKWIRSFGMVVLFLNPYFLYDTLNGLETSIALFFFSLFFLLALHIEEGRAKGGYYLIGIVAGIMVLARIDMAIYVLVFLCWLLARHGVAKGMRHAWQVGIAAAPPIFLWLGWNVANFHMLLTSASGAGSLVNHVLIVQDHGPSWGQFFKAIVYNTQYELDHFFRRTGMYTLAAGAIGALVALAARGAVPVPRRLKEITLTQALFVGFVLLFIANASVRWTARAWYFISFDIFLAILFVVVSNVVFAHILYKKTAAVLLTTLTLFSFYVVWSKDLSPGKIELSGQVTLRGAAEWMNANLPEDTRIGTFTPGIQGYFADAHVVDLDGLVNNSAYDAMKKRQLWQYILDEHITYLSTYDSHLTYRYKSFLGIENPLAHLQLVTEIPGTGGLKIYKVH